MYNFFKNTQQQQDYDPYADLPPKGAAKAAKQQAKG